MAKDSTGHIGMSRELREIRQRVLDEQAAFDHMEELYLKGQEGFRVLERELGLKIAMLEEQRRLMRLSNKKVVGLEERLRLYGDHSRTCPIVQGGSYYMEPVECDCGWDED